MYTTYKKTLYENRPGYSLNYTVGLAAGDSTLDHPHLCPDYMLFYFIHGSGTIKIEGKHYDIHPGDVFLTNPSELFHCTVNHGEYHQRMVLHINGQFLKTLPCDNSPLFSVFDDRDKGVGNCIPAAVVSAHGLDRQLLQILQLVQNPDPTNDILAICSIAALLAQLNRLPGHKAAEKVPESSLPEQILLYLNEHFSEKISVSSVAEVFNINQSHLLHLFKEHTGMSLWNYVILRRLHLFNELLRQEHSMEEACYRVGFQNYSNFFRLYKKYMGITPMQFKKQLLADN